MKKYKIVISILSALVIIESILLIHLWISRPKKIPKAAVTIKGKIAIVIDDFGYNLNNLPMLDEIKYHLTASVLPNLRYSREISVRLAERGFQVILHLPLEPYEKLRLEKNTIMTSMNEITIKNILQEDLASIGPVRGVSNHMGSRATQDPKIMSIIFEELKNRHLYFLDNLVSPKTICSDVAAKIGLPTAKRDIFLDNNTEPEYIRKQIHKLKTKARVYGQAIGVGHDRGSTLEVLKEVMPELEKEGYGFVFVSELVR